MVVILLLASMAVARIGDGRSAALSSSATVLEREFTRGIEQLVMAGSSINSELTATIMASGVSNLETVADPLYMGLTTKTWAISTIEQPNSTLLIEILSKLNERMQSATLGKLDLNTNTLTELVARQNVNIIAAYNDTRPQTVFLRFSKP